MSLGYTPAPTIVNVRVDSSGSSEPGSRLAEECDERPIERGDGSIFGAGLAVALAAFLALASPGCWRGSRDPVDDPSRLTIQLAQSGVRRRGMIPKEFTCDGADRSPPLEWSGVPRRRRSWP